jgi:site-specific DNA recombinase
VSRRVYGYRARRLPGVNANAVLEPDPQQAAVVERIFRLCGGGMGLVRIAKLLNDEGIPGPQRLSDAAIDKLQRDGKPVPVNHWQVTGVREVLNLELYVGVAVYGQYRQVGPKKKVRGAA